MVSLVLALLALAALLWLVSARPQSWWWIGALGAAGLVVLLSFVLPLLVEPLFLRFRSLEPGPVRDDVLGLARTADLAVADVLVADASRRTTALNAYVSGFGPTRRVVVFDTLLRRTPGRAGTSRRRARARSRRAPRRGRRHRARRGRGRAGRGGAVPRAVVVVAAGPCRRRRPAGRDGGPAGAGARRARAGSSARRGRARCRGGWRPARTGTPSTSRRTAVGAARGGGGVRARCSGRWR